MKKFIIQISLLFFILPSVCFAQKFTFKETKTNAQEKGYKKILIVGIGSVETRHFLETISLRLTKEFKSYEIESDFHYLGKQVEGANEQIKSLLSNNYDAVIVFSPTSASFFSVTTNSSKDFSTTVPGVGKVYPDNPVITSTFRNVTYSQEMHVFLYEISIENSLVWSADLAVDINPTEQVIYSRIAQKFFQSLKKSKILN